MLFSSDLNFWGLPSKQLIQHFIDIPFDILINFASDQNPVIDFICASSVAKFKVARYDNNKIYDLIISGRSLEDSEYLNEIERTLNNFSN